MSVQTLYTAATGMDAMEKKLDVIANNLANVNTTGFKKGRANFEDLFYRHEVLPGAEDQAGGLTATGTSIGLGTLVSSVQTDFEQGAFLETGNPLDLAIEGQGFLRVQNTDGTDVYTRAGNLSINANGQLVVGSANVGRLVQGGEITIPQGAFQLSISAEGRVQYMIAGNNVPQDAGQLELATFINPEGLEKLGQNLFRETLASGPPQNSVPGQDGTGFIRSNMLEASNVNPVRELIDLITTQRSFELNSQAVQAGDQILQLVANLRRY